MIICPDSGQIGVSQKKIVRGPLVDMYFAPYVIDFGKHLPEDGNKELTLLKCHLLIEQLLVLVIERNMVRPKLLPDLNFHKRLQLAQALTGVSKHEWIWTAIGLLNKARNTLGHDLDKRKMERELDEFMKYVESVEGVPPNDAFNGPMQRFQQSAFKVFMHTVDTVHFDPSDMKIKIILGNVE